MVLEDLIIIVLLAASDGSEIIGQGSPLAMEYVVRVLDLFWVEILGKSPQGYFGAEVVPAISAKAPLRSLICCYWGKRVVSGSEVTLSILQRSNESSLFGVRYDLDND